MKSTRILLMVGVAVVAAQVAACDSGDGDRPLNYKKGTYLGSPHTPLPEETLEELRARAAHQAGPTSVAFGGSVAGGGAAQADVRPPTTDAPEPGALRDRADRQRQ